MGLDASIRSPAALNSPSRLRVSSGRYLSLKCSFFFSFVSVFSSTFPICCYICHFSLSIFINLFNNHKKSKTKQVLDLFFAFSLSRCFVSFFSFHILLLSLENKSCHFLLFQVSLLFVFIFLFRFVCLFSSFLLSFHLLHFMFLIFTSSGGPSRCLARKCHFSLRARCQTNGPSPRQR